MNCIACVLYLNKAALKILEGKRCHSHHPCQKGLHLSILSACNKAHHLLEASLDCLGPGAASAPLSGRQQACVGRSQVTSISLGENLTGACVTPGCRSPTLAHSRGNWLIEEKAGLKMSLVSQTGQEEMGFSSPAHWKEHPALSAWRAHRPQQSLVFSKTLPIKQHNGERHQLLLGFQERAATLETH